MTQKNSTPRQKAQNFRSLKEITPRNIVQEDYLDSIEDNVITFGVGPAGTGKAQPLHAKIKTPSGWITMGDIKPGDEICTPAGKTAHVREVFPQGEKKYYKITFIDGSSAESCEEHLWKVWNQDWTQGYKVISLRDLIEYKNCSSKNKRLYIPLCNPVYGLYENHFISPYLMGALLGDGSFVLNTPRISTSDKEILEIFNKELPVDYKLSKVGKYDYSIKRKCKKNKPNDIMEELKTLGLAKKKSNEKFIPYSYMNGTVEQRLALLQGLMDTDGTAETTRGISYSTTSKRLAENVQEVVRSLGGLAKITCRITSYTYKEEVKKGKCSYLVTIRINKPGKLFRLERKKERLEGIGQYEINLKKRIDKIEYIGKTECQCILVDSPEHLYITDDYCVTHNTYLAMYQALCHLWNKKQTGFNRIILTRPAVEAGERLGFLPGLLEEKMDPYMRPLYDALYDIAGHAEGTEKIKKGIIEIAPVAFMRGRTLKNAFVILDEAQNCSWDQLKMIVTRLGENVKLVVNGDPGQSDLSGSGLSKMLSALQETEDVGIVRFQNKDVERSKIVKDVLLSIEKYEKSLKM